MTKLSIWPDPPSAWVTTEAVVRYEVRGGPRYWEAHRIVLTHKVVGAENAEAAKGNRITWYAIPAARWAERGDEPYAKAGDRVIDAADDEQSNTILINWAHLGTGEWRIVANATIQGQRFITSRAQAVSTVDNVLTHAITESFKNKKEAKDPYVVIAATQKFLRVLRDAESYGGFFSSLPPEKQREHHKLVADWQAYLDSMLALFGDSIGRDIRHYPVDAVFADRTTQETMVLRVLLVRERQHLSSGMDGSLWHLFDWTQPGHPAMCGRYHNAHEDPKQAIARVFELWNARCKYPPGHVRAVLPDNVPEGVQKWIEFETGDQTAFDEVAEFIDNVAFVASVVTAILTIFLPVPGSQVASIALWTSILSSAVSGVINLATPDQTAGDRISDNLFIVGMFFGAVGKIAKAGVPVLKSADGALEKFAFYGAASVDAVDGIITTTEISKQIDALLNDPSLSPLDRIKGLAKAVGQAGVTTVGFHGTAKDQANLDAIDADGTSMRMRLTDLGTPGKEVPLRQPVVEGKIGAAQGGGGAATRGGHTTQVQLAAGKPKKPRKPIPPPPPGKAPSSAASRGMRDIDDKIFAQAAAEKGYYIIVREGNADSAPYIGRQGDKDIKGRPVEYAGKPETLKAKTAAEGKHKGLACFDPAHRKTHELLAALPGHKQLTVDELMGGRTHDELLSDLGSEFTARYAYYLKALDKANFLVRFDDGHVVEHKETGVRYHGDYDIHGVYDKDGKRVQGKAYDAFRSEMNTKFGANLIQHGAHDNWSDVNNPVKAGINWGPQPPVIIFAPDGSIVQLGTSLGGIYKAAALKIARQQLKAYYEEHDLPWPYEKFEEHKEGYPIEAKY